MKIEINLTEDQIQTIYEALRDGKDKAKYHIAQGSGTQPEKAEKRLPLYDQIENEIRAAVSDIKFYQNRL